ncbi:type II secretion system protein [bacterium]|nr:type II secretion system protein [bacterium]
MKKFGFTLAELIIALSIIGVTSILVAPTVVNLMPDSNKAKVIKYYTQLSSAVNTILSDENIYRPYQAIQGNDVVMQNEFTSLNDNNNIIVCGPLGLSCLDNVPQNNEQPTNFPDFLRDRLGLVDDMTVDNSFWDIQYIPRESREMSYSVEITIREDENGCLYGEDGCDISDVNRFRFIIENYGSVVAGDPLTDAYLRNQLNMNSKKEDIETANRLIEEGIDYRR